MKKMSVKNKIFKANILFVVTIMNLMVLSSCSSDDDPEIVVQEITLDQKTLSLSRGESKLLTVTVLPENAVKKNVTWSSNDESVAKVDKTGLVTAIAAGNATITVTSEDGGKTAKCSITVSEIYQDNFDRNNSNNWITKDDSPNPIGENWLITDGYFKIENSKLKASQSPDDLPSGKHASIFYQESGAITKNIKGSFTLSADLIVDESTTWAGFILNAQDEKQFYVFRIKGGGAVHFLSTNNGGESWDVILNTGAPALETGAYHAEVSSSQKGVFNVKITNTAANTIHYEAQITDSRAQYGDGKAGLFFSGGADNIQFDNFSLQLR